MSDVDDFTGAASQLIPPGPFWDGFRQPGQVGHALLQAKAATLAEVDARSRRLLSEAVPTGFDETLESRELEAGLPDACFAAFDTIAERLLAVAARWKGRGGHSVTYFREVIASLGYEAEIDEFRPFVCGASECGGDDILGPSTERYVWRVRVLEPRLTEFELGVAQCGDHLGVFRRAEDLECVLQRIKPAGTTLIITYLGV